jgi:hypothetical protein
VSPLRSLQTLAPEENNHRRHLQRHHRHQHRPVTVCRSFTGTVYATYFKRRATLESIGTVTSSADRAN